MGKGESAMNRRGCPLFVGGWGEEGTEAFFVVDHFGVLITERFGFGQQTSLNLGKHFRQPGNEFITRQ